MTDQAYFTEIVEPDSSAIETLVYDEPTKSLYVEFVSGNLAAYANVSQSTFNELKTAPSVGRFYSQYIKGQYRGLDGDVYFVPREKVDPVETAAEEIATLAIVGKDRFGVVVIVEADSLEDAIRQASSGNISEIRSIEKVT